MIAYPSTVFRARTWQTALLLAAFAAAAARAGTTPVRVTAHNVNLRASPNPTGDLLGQAGYGDRLSARELGDEWVEIEPPSSVTGWIKAEYVLRPQNTIGANRVNVRAGSSINYNIIDTLPLGTPVEPVGELGEWLQIKAPPTARVWISRQFVDTIADDTPAPAPAPEAPPHAGKAGDAPSAPAPAAPPAPAPAAAATTPIVSPSVPEPDTASAAPGEIPVPPPKDLKLVPLNGQGRLTEVEGTLRAAPLINEAPTHYRVVRWQNNRWQILCHVYGDAGKFRSLKDRKVRVRGREYWIQKAAAPVLVPDRIREIPENPALD
ncbi:MAG: SH3 domain-containing protein [Kiritimatiellae bacterium]|nr:SH3 domain-containing protein [Kiritimatiellia bacterium]